MASKILRDFELADPGTREHVLDGIVERANDDEIVHLQAVLQRLALRCDILCGVSKASKASLPGEIQLQILHLLDVTDIYYCLKVSQAWRDLILRSQKVVDDLLREWFPALDDKTKLPIDRATLFSRALRKRHLRDTGRFRSRFTCGFVTNRNGLYPFDRIEGLQRGQIFKDLTCSASLHGWTPTSTRARVGTLRMDRPAPNNTGILSTIPRELSGGALSKHLYADGRLAWQNKPAPGEWAHPITVHDFQAPRRWELTLPCMRTRGIKLDLWAIGSDLVIARTVGQRVLYAWDLRSQAVDQVTLQNPPHKCFTNHRMVVIVTKSGDLLLWSFGKGLIDLNLGTAMPQDEGVYHGPAKRFGRIPRTPLAAFEVRLSTVMFHPRDEDVFFLATMDMVHYHDAPLLWVYEFKDRRCCRIFTCAVSLEKTDQPMFGATKADAHGTYKLLLEQGSLTANGVQVKCMTFNTLSTRFGALKFQAPLRQVDENVTMVWNKNLIFWPIFESTWTMRPWPFSAVGQILGARDDSPNPDSAPQSPRSPDRVPGAALDLRGVLETMVTSIVLTDTLDPRVFSGHAREASGQVESKADIVRSQDISRKYASNLDLGAAAGLRYVLSFYGGQCNSEGRHVKDCPRSPGLNSPERILYPINYLAHNALQDQVPSQAVAVCGDDDFLVVISNRDIYTVFAVDADGEIAEAMQHGASSKPDETSGGPC